MRCAGPSTPRPFALRWASRGGTPAAGNRWSRRSPSRRSSPPRNSRRREGGSMSDAKYHDRHAAGVYKAIALRFYSRYVEARQSDEFRGADLPPSHGRLPTSREVTDQYTDAIEEWLWERPASATAALALVEFAGVVTADRFLGEVLRDQVIAEERDAFYQTIALSIAAEWINKLALNELAERSLPGKGGAA